LYFIFQPVLRQEKQIHRTADAFLEHPMNGKFGSADGQFKDREINVGLRMEGAALHERPKNENDLSRQYLLERSLEPLAGLPAKLLTLLVALTLKF
jgi:hypothetical protein